MARANNNKYTSINFNHILEKNISSTSATTTATGGGKNQPSPSYSSIASSIHTGSNGLYKSHLASTRPHGRMLVLTRPTPKPISTAILPSSPSSLPSSVSHIPQQPQKEEGPDPKLTEQSSDQISLRPLGRTGQGSETFSPALVQEKDKEVGAGVGSPKPNKFVPPHLRPGFMRKEERPRPEAFKGREPGQRYLGPPGRHGEDGRPKSGGYERMMRGGETDLGLIGRPRSSGSRPSSSGSW